MDLKARVRPGSGHDAKKHIYLERPERCKKFYEIRIFKIIFKFPFIVYHIKSNVTYCHQ